MKIHSSISRRLGFLVTAALLLLCAFPARATVNVIGYWRMGENDPGATNGGPVTNSIDSIVGNNLVFATNSTYSADVTPLAVTRVNSSLSVSLTNQSYALAATIVTNATDHFGIEAWVKPMVVNGTAQVIVYNGNTAISGWGIFLDANNNFSGLFGGAAIITGTPAQAGVWTDVALVRNSPNTILYINGVAVATNNISPPAVPAGGFAIGTPPQSPTGEFFTGLVDEVRVFAFAADQFTTNDLLANAGLPGARADVASPVTANSSALNGYVFPNGAPTTAWFLWGTTLNYDHTNAPISVPASNNSSLRSNVIMKLGQGTIHYALMVSNVLGTNISQDSMFTVGGFGTTTITATGLPNLIDGSSAWGDYDNDGRLDVLLSGFATNGAITQIFHNNGDGTFSNINAGLDIVFNGSVAWGDYDNDGKLDVLISGNGITEVWHNNGDGTFSLNTNANLTGLVNSSAAWGDYDNDGRPDILIAGNSSIGILREPTLVLEVCHNNGDGTFSNIQANITPIISGSVAWGDFDNDGRLDILLTGNSVTQIWRNNGNGTFSNINAGLPGLRFSFAAWGDYDNDGYPDVLLSGKSSTLGILTQVWHNNGNGTFSLNTNANPTALFEGSVAWGDYDNDGRLDILLSGDLTGAGTSFATEVWHNNGDGTFSNLVGTLPNSTASFVTWGDYDNDGRLDILAVANYQGQRRTQLWKNQTLQPNTPPQAPAGLFAQTSGTNIIFHWSPAFDAQTPAAGLTYNLRIGSSPGALNIVAPLSANNGFVKVPQSGNAQMSLNKSFFASLGIHYYWSVQAVDTSFAGSPFATEQSFELLPVLAPVGASNPVFGDANGDGTVDGAEVITVLSHLTTNGTIGPDALNLALRNYFAAYPLVMSNVDGLGSSKILFTLPNSPDPNLSVQSSTDLVNWDSLGPVNYGFIDTNGVTNPHRFYRLSYP